MADIAYSNDALKALAKMPKRDAQRIMFKINDFAANPQGQHSWAPPLVGRPEHRIRQGQWRALVEYSQADDRLFVLDIGHRREIYR